MNVTDQIIQSHLIYGGSDHTAAHALSPARCLNYAQGPTMQRPIHERVTVMPQVLHYADQVGLFGVENCFVKVNLDIQDSGSSCFDEIGWQCLNIIEPSPPDYDAYVAALESEHLDLLPVGGYDPAVYTNRILGLNRKVIGVQLSKLSTGNIYNDAWLDVRLYTQDRQEHPYDLLYVGPKDHFYIGFHARNTRRLGYDVTCMVGVDFAERGDVDPRYLSRAY